jgi:ubiquinone/menaquinone biosynthesis C-methylase UbiE
VLEVFALNHQRFYGDERERRKWQDAESILASIGLRQGFTFVDVGCGEGFFTLPAAKLVGRNGKVYGLDIDDEAIRRLKRKAAEENVKNLSLTAGEAEEIVLCKTCADIVFFSIVLHDFSDPAKVLINAKQMLKPTGRLVNLDWKKEPMELGPPLQIRFSVGHAAKLIEAAGFKIENSREAEPYHYLIIARP